MRPVLPRHTRGNTTSQHKLEGDEPREQGGGGAAENHNVK